MRDLEKSRCCTAWVGQLPEKTTKKDIMDLFKEFNPQSCKIIEKTKTNRFAFVYFGDEQVRDRAIAAKSGNSTIRGQRVIVNRSFNAYEGPRLGGKERYDWEWDITYRY